MLSVKVPAEQSKQSKLNIETGIAAAILSANTEKDTTTTTSDVKTPAQNRLAIPTAPTTVKTGEPPNATIHLADGAGSLASVLSPLSPLETVIEKLSYIEHKSPTTPTASRSSMGQLFPNSSPLKLSSSPSLVKPLANATDLKRTWSNGSSGSNGQPTTPTRRKSRTHSAMANTTVGLREIAKKIGSTPLVWEAPPKTVMIVTKLHDKDLIALTKKVSLWLIDNGLSVLVEKTIKDDPLFGYQDILDTIQEKEDEERRQQQQQQQQEQEEDSGSSSFLPSDDSSGDVSSDSSEGSIIKTPTSSDSDKPYRTHVTFWDKEYCATPEARREIDFIITLGGDGTCLFAAWLFQENSWQKNSTTSTPPLSSTTNPSSFDFPRNNSNKIPPIIPFNLGSLGFLTVFEFKNFRETIKRITTDEYGVRMNIRMRIACTVHRQYSDTDDEETTRLKKQDDGNTYLVLNDLCIDRGSSPYVSQLDLYGNDRKLTVVQADGLVVATPTGSTAYSLSAGGSLVHPELSAILVTPICPHTLSFRPMLLPDTMELKVKLPETSRATAFVSFDGRHKLQLFKGDYITINASNFPIPTVCLGDQSSDWFDSLEKSLQWNKRDLQKGFLGEKGEILEW